MTETHDAVTAFLVRTSNPRLAYLRHQGALGKGVVFLPGFNSAMTGTKGAGLHAWAVQNRRSFLRFDYSGHGASEGQFVDGTISQWRQDALDVLDSLTEGPQILVGSSMGGWLALLAALARPERVAGLVLIAPACDFTERLLWAGLPEDARRAIADEGVWMRPSQYGPEPYPITRTLIEDGRRHLLMETAIQVDCPVRILHGMQDPDVPWRHGLALVELLRAQNVTFELIKSGDHRLSDPASLARIAWHLSQA
jgi:pimeloyl-ACP methyl ester carboxylesterase